jgi:hypothetical protein
MRKTTLLIILWASTGLLAREPQGIQYLFPKPGTGQHPRETVLIFRFHTTPDHIQNRDSFFTITGEVSGPISGVLVEGTDGRTLVFRPAVDFYPGETVIVELRPRRPDGILIADTVYSFTVSPQRESPFQGESVRR